jgi:type II secretory pathway pseudopilin PulG
LNSLAFRPVRAVAFVEGSSRRGSTLVELLVAVAVLMVGLLAFTRTLGGALELGRANRRTAQATAAAQAIVERLFATDPTRVFALYNDDPDDDPDGPGTAPGSRFAVADLEACAADGGRCGKIFFPVAEDQPGVLREDLVDAKLRTPLDLDLDGTVDDVDHSGDYRLLPVRIRIAWQDWRKVREIELSTIVGVR